MSSIGQDDTEAKGAGECPISSASAGAERHHLMPDPCRSPDGAGPSISDPISLVAPGPTRGEPLPIRDAELRRAIDALDPDGIACAAGAVLEHIADRLSWTRGMSIVAGRGDGSLADRWPSVAHALRKTDADDIAEQVTRSPVFRNLVAPQGDDRGRSASTAEATRFGTAVLSLLRHTRCASCGQWWSASPPGASRWTCRCRSLVVVTRPNTR